MTVGGPGRVTRRIYSGWVGDIILTVCKYRLFMGLILFRLVALPLQPRVLGSYLVWSTWFSSRLPLEGTDRIQIFGL
jgi:hypothetical protein